VTGRSLAVILLDMTDADPNLPGDPLPPPGAPTQAMPVTPTDGEYELATPWYKQPGIIAAIVVGVLLIGGLIAALLWLGGDDDDADVVAATVVLVPKDESGAGLERGFLADVTGTTEFPTSFIWLEPESVPGPDGITGSTDGADRVTFAWAPAAEVVEPETWTSTITFVETAPPGFVEPGPVVECVLARPEEQNTTVSMDVVVDPPDPTVERLVTYTFPNHEFLPGDTVTCELVSQQLPPESTTTVPESTTTVPEETTTVPEETTTVPETTAPPATDPPATTPPATDPPATDPPATDPPSDPATATEALQAAGDYGTFLSLASGVPSVEALLDGAGPITVFAPTDDALSGVNPLTDPDDLEELLLSHIVDGDALDAAAIFDGSRTEVTMASGGTQPVDQAAGTVGGASVAEADLTSTNGVSHGIDTVLSATS